MRWSPVALLPPVFFLFLLAVARAPPGKDHAQDDVDDIFQANSTKILAHAQRASDIFIIDDGPGGCADREAALDLWVQEAGKLHLALLQFQHNILISPTAGALFYAWLGVGPKDVFENSKVWQVITDHTARVQQFLSGGGLRDPQVKNEKPRVFCGAEMGEYQPWNAPLRDHTGEDVEDEDWGVLPLRLAYPDFSDTKCKAFWVQAFKGYDIDCNGDATLCPVYDAAEMKARGAKTAARIDKFPVDKKAGDFTLGLGNRHVLFCPPTFNPGTSHAVESLEKATSSAKYPKASVKAKETNLDALLTVSATMYHELYHLTDGKDDADTFDLSYAMNNIIETHARNDQMRNAQNPETYVFLAMACYMYLNPSEGAARAVYFTGWPHTIDQVKEIYPYDRYPLIR